MTARPPGSREARLEVTAHYRPRDQLRREVRHDGSVVLDGRHATDLTVGEAELEMVLGPSARAGVVLTEG